MKSKFFLPEFNNIYLKDIWNQQDGATTHYANEMFNYCSKKLLIELMHEMVLVIGP